MYYLLDACELGDLQCVKGLLRWNAYQNNGVTVHSEGGEPFRRAAQYGHLEVLKYLQTQDNGMNESELYSAFRSAAYNGRLTILEYLVDLGAGADVPSDNNVAVWNAARGGHLDCIKFLVSRGADITRVTEDEDVMSDLSSNKKFEVVKYLVDHGASREIIYGRTLRYIQFCDRKKIKAQKKLYYWWIQICYNMERECGKRMAQKNLEEYKKLILLITNGHNKILINSSLSN